jgi:outer membrane protein assembly factor BamB
VAFGGRIRGIDPATGKDSWKVDLPHAAKNTTVRLDIRGELLYALAGQELVCIRAETGEIRWRQVVNITPVNSSLLVVGSYVIAAGNGEAQGFSALDGAPRWHNEYPGEGLGEVALAGDGHVVQADQRD